MTETFSNHEIEVASEAQVIRDTLSELGLLCTDKNPTALVVNVDDDLPLGWLRISDDYEQYACGNGSEIGIHLACCDFSDSPEAEAADLFRGCVNLRPSAKTWPKTLLHYELLTEEEGDCAKVVTLVTNAGIRFAAGPDGAFSDCIADWHGPFALSRDEAIRIAFPNGY